MSNLSLSHDYVLYYRAGNWIADASPNSNYSDIIGIDGTTVLNEVLALGTVSVKIKENAGFVPSATINIQTGNQIYLERYVTIDGSAQSFDIFTANNVSNFCVLGGIVKSEASYVAVKIEGTSSDFEVKIRAKGGGGGIYVTGTANDGTVACEGQNLGLAVSTGSPAATDGVPVFLDELTSKVLVEYSRNIDSSGSGVGTVNAWSSGVFRGSYHQIEAAFSENSAGGGALVGSALASSNRTHDIQLGQIMMNLGNTWAFGIQNCYNIQVGRINSYKAGAFSAAGKGEAGVNFYGNYQNVTVSEIISSYSQAEGVIVGTADSHTCSNLHIGRIISYDNYQGASGSGGQSGLYLLANNSSTLTDVTIDDSQVFDDQGTHTQLYGANIQTVSGATLTNVRIKYLTGTGNVTALRTVNLSGTVSGWFDFGLSSLTADNTLTGQTADVSSLCSVTSDLATVYEVGSEVQCTAFTSGTEHVSVSYTDPYNNVVTKDFGTITATGIQNFSSMNIRAKAGTIVKIVTSGSAVATYDISGWIRAKSTI